MITINKKGIGLIGAIMMITILLIMSLGFFQLTNYSTSSTISEINKLELYWAAESASNYNINWWSNQEDDVRKIWPSTYTIVEAKSEITDDSGDSFKESIFPGAEGTTSDGILYLHSSWKYEGIPKVNADLSAMDGFQIYLTRYKGERKDRPGEAVWVLESTAYDPATDNAVKITMSNIYNIDFDVELFWLQQAEAISSTMAGLTGTSNRGFFGNNDYRYGDCYFSDVLQLNYPDLEPASGPHFFGSVKSSAKDMSGWDASLFKQFTTYATSDISQGLAGVCSKWGNEDEAFKSMSSSFEGGFIKNAEVVDANNFVWTWEDIEENSGQSGGFGIYNVELELPTLIKSDKYNVDIELQQLDPAGTGSIDTYAVISQSGTVFETIKIGDGGDSWQMIAVPDGYGNVSIQGISDDNFALATESSTIDIAGDLYLSEMSEVNDWLHSLEGEFSGYTVDQKKEVMSELHARMAAIHPEGHLGLLSCLGNKEGDVVNEESFSIVPEELIFMNAAMISWNGSLEALKATAEGTDLRFFNIGSSITLGSQAAIAAAASDKWDNYLIQDARYTHEDEDTFLGVGTSPSMIEHETLNGINHKHTWNKTVYGGIGGEGRIYSILPGTQYQ